MKGSPQSRGLAASNSADHSNASSNETIGTDNENLNGSNASGAIGTIDPNDNSYFIQYHPEVAEKLSKHNSTYSVSGRCLSIVFSRMLYWSKYAKWRYNGKLFYWKNQTELSQETSFSVKQINRALKVLVELGLLVREKFQKHYYRQVYFYHIPSSPHTKELQQPTRTTSSSAAKCCRTQQHDPSGQGVRVYGNQMSQSITRNSNINKTITLKHRAEMRELWKHRHLQGKVRVGCIGFVFNLLELKYCGKYLLELGNLLEGTRIILFQ